MARGIPLGAVISPLLCNVALHPLDRALVGAGHLLVRYADDFVALCPSEAAARQAYDLAGATLDSLRLRYEPHKTAVTTFGAGFDFLGVHFERDRYTILGKTNASPWRAISRFPVRLCARVRIVSRSPTRAKLL